jgi:hypothetical protein
MSLLRFDHPDLHLDASENLNLRRALEHVRAKTYDKQFPEFKARKFVPIDNEVNTGAESVAFDTYEEVGDAEMTADYSTDAPVVNVKASSQSQLIRGMQSSYAYSLQELRAAAMSGSRLSERKANAARRAIEQRHETILLLGDSNWGLSGLFNLASTSTYTVPVGDAGSKGWATKTPDEILTDMFGMENAIIEGTNEVEQPDTLILPLTAYNDVKTRRMGDGIDGTVLQFFLKNAQAISMVESSTKLQSNAAWTGRRMVAYRRDKDKLAGVIPQEFEQLAPQISGMVTKIVCHSRTGGVELYYPKSVCYGDEF